MRLATFHAPARERPIAGEVRGDEVVAFSEGATVRDVLAAGAQAAVPDGESWPLDQVSLLAPVPDPGAIYCIGLT
jgi:hypothetical protein